MTEHLGHEKNRAPDSRTSANIRNRTRSKTVLTAATGPVEIEVPRDRDGSFELVIIQVAAAPADRGRRGGPLVVRARPDHRGDPTALQATSHRSTGPRFEGDHLPDHRQGGRGDGRVAEPATGGGPRRGLHRRHSLTAWSRSATDRSPTGRSTPRSGSPWLVTQRRQGRVLGLWAGTGGEGAKFWMSVLTDIRARGTRDVFFVVCDGLKGCPRSSGTCGR